MARSLIGVMQVGLVGSLLLASRAEAAPADTTTYLFPEVEVTALRGRDRLGDIPASTFVIGHERIRASGVSRISSLLQRLPGLYGYQQTSNGDPAVVDPRGFTANGESSYLKLLVNGQDARDVENGDVDWDWVLPRDVERLEVVEGPGAWVYGDGAQGGIVNIVRPVAPDGTRLGYGAQAGSYGYASGTGSLSRRWEHGSGELRGSAKRLDGWRDRSRERVFGGGLDGQWNPSERRRLGLNVSWLDADRDDPGALRPDQIDADRSQADTQTDFNHSQRLMVGARFTQGLVDESEWTVAPYFRLEDGEQVKTLLYQTKSHPTEALTGGAELGWRKATELGGRALLLSVGGDVEQSKLTSRYFAFDGAEGPLETHVESWRTTLSGFVSARMTLDPRTSLRLGFRQDAIRVRAEDKGLGTEAPENTFWLSSPFAGITRHLGTSATVFGSYSTAFRAPTLNQMFDRRPYFNPFINDNVYLSNPDLAPQRSHGTELGARFTTPASGQAQVTGYAIWVKDEIDFDAATVSYGNISRSFHGGVQAALDQPLFARLSMFGSATYSPTTIDGGDNDGNQINAVPREMVYGSLRWEGEPSWSLEAGLRWVGRQYLDKENTHPLADYHTVDMSGSVRLAGLTIALRVQNLLDAEYSDTGYLVDLGPGFVEERLYPVPGRSFGFSVSAH